MTENEIKKVLYKEKPIAKLKGIYRDGGSRNYIAETSLGFIVFFVPFIEIKENRELFTDELPAQLLIRYLRVDKSIELQEFITKYKEE